MTQRRCPYCQKPFTPTKWHPAQTVCSQGSCQKQRRSRYRRHKVAADPRYREACLQSARQWRKEHPEYWKQYRAEHPASVEGNRQAQTTRDRKQYLKTLANNTVASQLTLCPATVWVFGPELHHLANNTWAPAQVWILEGVPPPTAGRQHLANNIPLAQ